MIAVTDMHCHILPGVDDGAKSMEVAEGMLRIAYREGIRRLILTPHYHIGRPWADTEKIKIEYEKFSKTIKEKYKNLELFLGQEIYYHSEALEKVKSGKALTMAGSDYVLLEFTPLVSFEDIRDAVNEFTYEGYSPILAHVERYQSLIKKADAIEDLIESGAYIQVNASSLLGGFFRTDTAFVKKLLKNKLVHFVGTDAHSMNNRPPKIREAYNLVEKKYGKEYAYRIFSINQKKILNNEVI